MHSLFLAQSSDSQSGGSSILSNDQYFQFYSSYLRSCFGMYLLAEEVLDHENVRFLDDPDVFIVIAHLLWLHKFMLFYLCKTFFCIKI